MSDTPQRPGRQPDKNPKQRRNSSRQRSSPGATAATSAAAGNQQNSDQGGPSSSWAMVDPQSVLLNPNSRIQRNLAEKYRRDKMNNFIAELSRVVPTVYLAAKKPDKTSVLRLAANYLRVHNGLRLGMERCENWPKVVNVERMLSDLDSFMLVITDSGRIVYVSESVEKLLGFSQVELMGRCFFQELVHDGDRDIAMSLLEPTDDPNGISRSVLCRVAEKGLSRSRPTYFSAIVSGHLRKVVEEKPLHRIQLRFQGKSSPQQSTSGSETPASSPSLALTSSTAQTSSVSPRSDQQSNGQSSMVQNNSPQKSAQQRISPGERASNTGSDSNGWMSAMTPRHPSSSDEEQSSQQVELPVQASQAQQPNTGGRSDPYETEKMLLAERIAEGMAVFGEASSDEEEEDEEEDDEDDPSKGEKKKKKKEKISWMFVAIIAATKVPLSLVGLSMIQAVRDEYVMRNDVQGRIVSVDHRISYLTGYTVSEVRGLNAFHFIYERDRPRIAQEYMKMLYNSEDGTGVVIYRLVTKSCQFVYLRTRGFLEFNKLTHCVDSYVCINTLITEEEAFQEDPFLRAERDAGMAAKKPRVFLNGPNDMPQGSPTNPIYSPSSFNGYVSTPGSATGASPSTPSPLKGVRKRNRRSGNDAPTLASPMSNASSPSSSNGSQNSSSSAGVKSTSAFLNTTSSYFFAQQTMLNRPEFGNVGEEGEIMAPVPLLSAEERKTLRLASQAPKQVEVLIEGAPELPETPVSSPRPATKASPPSASMPTPEEPILRQPLQHNNTAIPATQGPSSGMVANHAEQSQKQTCVQQNQKKPPVKEHQNGRNIQVKQVDQKKGNDVQPVANSKNSPIRQTVKQQKNISSPQKTKSPTKNEKDASVEAVPKTQTNSPSKQKTIGFFRPPPPRTLALMRPLTATQQNGVINDAIRAPSTVPGPAQGLQVQQQHVGSDATTENPFKEPKGLPALRDTLKEPSFQQAGTSVRFNGTFRSPQSDVWNRPAVALSMLKSFSGGPNVTVTQQQGFMSGGQTLRLPLQKGGGFVKHKLSTDTFNPKIDQAIQRTLASITAQAASTSNMSHRTTAANTGRTITMSNTNQMNRAQGVDPNVSQRMSNQNQLQNGSFGWNSNGMPAAQQQQQQAATQQQQQQAATQQQWQQPSRQQAANIYVSKDNDQYQNAGQLSHLPPAYEGNGLDAAASGGCGNDGMGMYTTAAVGAQDNQAFQQPNQQCVGAIKWSQQPASVTPYSAATTVTNMMATMPTHMSGPDVIPGMAQQDQSSNGYFTAPQYAEHNIIGDMIFRRVDGPEGEQANNNVSGQIPQSMTSSGQLVMGQQAGYSNYQAPNGDISADQRCFWYDENPFDDLQNFGITESNGWNGYQQNQGTQQQQQAPIKQPAEAIYQQTYQHQQMAPNNVDFNPVTTMAPMVPSTANWPFQHSGAVLSQAQPQTKRPRLDYGQGTSFPTPSSFQQQQVIYNGQQPCSMAPAGNLNFQDPSRMFQQASPLGMLQNYAAH